MTGVPAPREVDPRGLRFGAALTTIVLAAVLLTQSVLLLAAQVAVFAVGAFGGVRRSPYSLAYATLVRPRVGPPPETEDARPPQFAQLVGLAFGAVALVGFVTGAELLGLIATGVALAAAFLNAAFGFCLGCEVYVAARRFSTNLVDNTRSKDNDRATVPTEVSP